MSRTCADLPHAILASPPFQEWSTKAVRDAFFASPKFPRLLNADAVKDTISRGLDGDHFAYVGKAADGTYDPFIFKKSLPAGEVEIADDVFLISRERAETVLAGKAPAPTPQQPPPGSNSQPPQRPGSGEQTVPLISVDWALDGRSTSAEMDAVLHQEVLAGRDQRKHEDRRHGHRRASEWDIEGDGDLRQLWRCAS